MGDATRCINDFGGDVKELGEEGCYELEGGCSELRSHALDNMFTLYHVNYLKTLSLGATRIYQKDGTRFCLTDLE